MKEIKKIVYILQKRAIVPIAVAASLASIFALLSELLPKDIVPIAVGIAASIIGAAIAFSMAEALRLIRSKKIIFISYTHSDTEVVHRIIEHLSDLNIKFLVDRIELKVGDNIKNAVGNMIEASDYIIFIVSKSSTNSTWAQKELEQAISSKKKILPVVLDKDCVPEILSGLYYADLSEGFEDGLEQLRKTLASRK